MRARNYDPTTGRFTQRDSVGPALGEPVFSPYVFAHDMPTTKADPTGLVTDGQVNLANRPSTGTRPRTERCRRPRYGATEQGGIKVGPKIVAFFSETAAVAAPGIEQGAAAAARGLAGASEGAAGAEASAGERLGSAAGKLLGAAGIALAIYFTVEDCEHGTIYQCVGDSVGLAIGAACMVATEGIGSVACALAAAGIGIVIAEYGPEMVAGLVDLGQYAAEGATIAIAAISKGFDAAGESLTSAYAEAASQVSAGFALVGTATVSGFDTAIGAISTGFDRLGSYLSSGFADALSTLEQAGLDAAEFAGLLKDTFGEGFNNAVDALITFGYDVDGVAKSLENVFSTGAAAAAAFLKDNWNYSYDQIASGLETAYDQLAEGAASILKNIGAGIDDIPGKLERMVTGEAPPEISQGLNYTIDQISTELKDIYNLADQATAQILKGLNYTVNEIAGTLQSVFNDAYQGAAQVLNDIGYQVTEIASAIRDAFSSVSDVDMAALLQNTLGFTPSGRRERASDRLRRDRRRGRQRPARHRRHGRADQDRAPGLLRRDDRRDRGDAPKLVRRQHHRRPRRGLRELRRHALRHRQRDR
jgi:hypothetical protein